MTKIYAACLASYNNGRLYGQWIDCEGKDASELGQEINTMLAKSPYPNVTRARCADCGHYQDVRPDMAAHDFKCGECGSDDFDGPFRSAEEYAIHDHEGFCGLLDSEYPSLEDVAALAEGLDSDCPVGFAYLVDDLKVKPTDALDNADDVIVHCVDSGHSDERALGEYAAEIYEDGAGITDALPDIIKHNIDWNGIGHDLQQAGDIRLFTHDGERWIIGNANQH